MVTEEELSAMSPEEIAEFQKKNCIFCQIATGKVPAKTVYSDDECAAVLDINPATKGHILLMPKEHYSVMPQVPEYVLEHVSMVAKGLSQASLKALRCRGTTIFIANGVAAGQRAPHFMMHIIPRYDGDGLPLNIPAKELPKKETDAIAKLLRASFGQKEKTTEKPAEKINENKGRRKAAVKKTAKSRKFDLDKISRVL